MAQVSSTMRSTPKRVSARRWAASTGGWSPASTRRIAAARAAGSSLGTMWPASPTTSGKPPALLTITGTPASIASTTAWPMPSSREGWTKTSAAA